MWSVDDEHVSPLYQLLENFPCFRRFKVECEAALVAVSQLKGIRLFRIWLGRDLLPYSPQLALRWFDFDYVRAEVGQDYRGDRVGYESRKCDYILNHIVVVRRIQ